MPNLVRFIGTRKFRWKALYFVRWLFKLVGADWNDFYAWMLNFQDRQVTLDQILSRPPSPNKFKGLWDWHRGAYYLAYMKRYGMRPTHTVLDIGCGYGRVAIPVLKEQQAGGMFIGTEITARRLDLAREWIQRENLEYKSFDLILSKDNRLPFIEDSSVDVVWVLSVFNHMPDAELDILLTAIKRVTRPGGIFFCYYLADTANGDSSAKTFRRSDVDMEARLDANGFDARHLTDWDNDLAVRGDDSRMLLGIRRDSDKWPS
jgi:SAM-dependent methyltransferase